MAVVQFGEGRSSNSSGGGSAAAAAAAAARAEEARRKQKQKSKSGGGGGRSGGNASGSYGGAASRRNGSYSGGGAPMGSNSQGQYTRPSGPPAEGPGPVPTLDSFLGTDTTYQNQLRNFAKALTDMTADITRRKGVFNSEFAQSDKALRDQRGLDLEALEEDYASRGILKSGVYGGAVSDYETEFNKRIADLLRRRNQSLGALDQELLQFRSAQELQKQAAREAAARRRAETYGV